MKEKDVYQSTTSGTKNRGEDGRGRPTKHEGQTQNITIIFDEGTADRLRMQCIKMKKANGSKFSMNEFVRPVVEAVLESKLDLSRVDSENELKEYILTSLED